MTDEEIEIRLQTAANNGVGFSAEVLNYINSLKEQIENLSTELGQAQSYVYGLENEKQLAEIQPKEILSALYQRTDNERGFTFYRKDIVELAKDYEIKEEELK